MLPWTVQLIILGIENKICSDEILNLIILLSKQHIYQAKVSGEKPNLIAFQRMWNLRYKVEKERDKLGKLRVSFKVPGVIDSRLLTNFNTTYHLFPLCRFRRSNTNLMAYFTLFIYFFCTFLTPWKGNLVWPFQFTSSQSNITSDFQMGRLGKMCHKYFVTDTKQGWADSNLQPTFTRPEGYTSAPHQMLLQVRGLGNTK